MRRLFEILFLALPIICTAGCTPRQKTKTGVPSSQNVVTDVPALIGKNYTQVVAAIGKPKFKPEPSNPKVPKGIWVSDWWFDNGLLTVEYQQKSLKVVSFFLATSESAYGTKDQTALLAAGKLKRSDPRYKITFVKAKGTSNQYTGVIIVPN
jgi:hypothetical protein